MSRQTVRGVMVVLVLVTAFWGAGAGVLEPSADADAPSGVSALPPWLHKTMHARAYVPPTAPFVPNVQPAGTSVLGSGVSAIVSDGGPVRFGLASVDMGPGQTYPGLSTDDGVTWHVDGPLFHVDAAQGAAFVGSVGALRPRGAYFWGQGGNVIWTTYDEGLHWWILSFGAGVDRVSANKGELDAVVFGDQVKHGDIQRLLYVSKDSGRIWSFRREVSSLSS
jgi:hypothetical protein